MARTGQHENSSKTPPAANRDEFRMLFNNTAINRALPVSALKVNEKDTERPMCSSV